MVQRSGALRRFSPQIIDDEAQIECDAGLDRN
jgi:hypothetical protein